MFLVEFFTGKEISPATFFLFRIEIRRNSMDRDGTSSLICFINFSRLLISAELDRFFDQFASNFYKFMFFQFNYNSVIVLLYIFLCSPLLSSINMVYKEIWNLFNISSFFVTNEKSISHSLHICMYMCHRHMYMFICIIIIYICIRICIYIIHI